MIYLKFAEITYQSTHLFIYYLYTCISIIYLRMYLSNLSFNPSIYIYLSTLHPST